MNHVATMFDETEDVALPALYTYYGATPVSLHSGSIYLVKLLLKRDDPGMSRSSLPFYGLATPHDCSV